MQYFVRELRIEYQNLESSFEILLLNGQFLQYRNIPSYRIYQYFFRVFNLDILHVAGISISLFGSQVKKKHLHSGHLASY
jgi:hypothetical protein